MLWYLKPLKLTGMEGMSTSVTMVEEEVLTYGKTVNMYFLGDWHLPISTVIAKVGSLQSCPAKGLDLNKLGAPYTHDLPLDPLVCK